MNSGSVSVTGATGFVGWHIADNFVRHGWDVRAVVRRGNKKPVPVRTTLVEADLTALSLKPAFAGADVVVHCAALVRAANASEFQAVNVEGTHAAAEAARRAGAHFILISSQAAGGPGTPAAPRRESDPPEPVNAYGRSKLAAEEAVRKMKGLRWTILRPSAVYGPRDRGFLPLFKMARRGLLLSPARPRTAFTLLHIEDLVEAVRLTVMAPESDQETMFLGHAEPKTGFDVLRTIAHTSGRGTVPRRVPGPMLSIAAGLGDLAWKFGATPVIDSGRLAEWRAPGFVCSVERARAVLGFSAYMAMEDGIARTARWYRDNHWL